MTGPLSGILVIELEGLGPVPHAGMQLADLGAEVVRVVRPGEHASLMGSAHLLRGRRVVAADLKDHVQLSGVLGMIRTADVLLEGFRPGVAERLGLGPEECFAQNPRLVYARVTGWGQSGPLSATGGHDINFIAATGALHAIGTPDTPVPPLSLLGNYGGAATYTVIGVLSALLQREHTGRGELIDVATIDAVSSLMQAILELRAHGEWSDRRGENLLDGGRPYYAVYSCSDGRHVAVGAMEPHLYANLLTGLGLRDAGLPDQEDPDGWPLVRAAFARTFAAHPRAHWERVFAELDACVTPVLTITEAADHPQLRARQSLVDGPNGITAAPAPRFASHDTHD